MTSTMHYDPIDEEGYADDFDSDYYLDMVPARSLKYVSDESFEKFNRREHLDWED